MLSSKNMSLFDNTIININADIQVIVATGNNQFEIHDIYNPASEHGGNLQTRYLGYFNESDGYQAREHQSKYWIRKNMFGITFRSGVVLPEKFGGSLINYLESDEHRDINTFNRFHARVMGYCRDYYNFTIKIILEKSWGYKINDTSFDGLVGDLERKTLDFGYSPLFVRADRATVMEYGRRTWTLRAAFIFRNPKAKTSVEVFLKPLSWSIWLCTIFLATSGVVALKLSFTCERKQLDLRNIDITWSCLVLRTVGAFCQQGLVQTPTLFCGRITTIFIFLLSILIYQFYSASIVSNLLQKPATVVKSIEQILRSTMQAGCEDVLYNRDYFLYTTDQSARELYFKKILGNHNASHFLTAADGIELVKKGDYAFHVELATAYPIIRDTFGDKEICELREVQLYRTQPMHANLQKYSPFRDMIDTCLQRLAESGILFREINHWHPKKPDCIQSSKSVVFNVGLDDFYPALMSLGIGMCASLIILTIEFYVARTNNRETKNIKLHPFTL